MPAFPADAYGNIIPVLAPVYGSSLEQAVTTTSGAAMAINATGGACLIEVFAIGCDLYYKTGTSGVTAPVLGDGMIFAGTSKPIPMPAGHTHVRCYARTGSGTARAEYLG